MELFTGDSVLLLGTQGCGKNRLADTCLAMVKKKQVNSWFLKIYFFFVANKYRLGDLENIFHYILKQLYQV